MPISYEIDLDRRLVITTARSVITTAEIRDFMAELAQDPLFDPTFDQLADFMGVTDVLSEIEDVRAIAGMGRWSSTSRRVACFSKTHIFGMARIYEVMCEVHGMNFRPFRSRERAEAYLASPREGR